MTIFEIIEKHLTDNGFDGLFNPAECGCKLDDLAPCGEMQHCCEPGYLQPGDDEADFYIGSTKHG